MEDSHLISPNIKEYCAKFNIENILNDAINEILTKYPQDPYSLLYNHFKKVRSYNKIIIINSIVNQYIK